MIERFAYLRDLFGAQAQLAILRTWIIHIEDPLGMAFAACAFGAAGAVKGGALEEGSAQDIAAVEGCGEFVPFPNGALTCHLYR